MVQTRAAALPPPPQNVNRRNPSRKSRPSTTRDTRRSKRPYLSARRTRDLSSDEDSSDSSQVTQDADSDSDNASIHDPRIAYVSRQVGRRVATTSSRRRSLRRQGPSQAATPQFKQETKRPNSPSSTQAETPQKRRKTSCSPEEPLYNGIIPDWRDPKMPYHAWTDIFYYAATTGGPDNLDVNWLINVATTCKSFSEAALAAIYQCPPIISSGKAKRLVALLERPSSETRFNYRAKIRSLYIDISIVPQALLYKLVHPLPRLKELVFFTTYDQPPYRELDRTVRWHYNEDIFRAFLPETDSSSLSEPKHYHTKLESWEWSGRLLGGYVPTIQDISRIHQEPSFAHLSKISFTNFQVPSLYKPRPKSGDEEAELQMLNEDGIFIDSIAGAISELKSLKHLVFESSTVMNDRLLRLLPKDLNHLSLINCWEVKSDDLEAFLQSHGGHLRRLVLAHNQSLDMAFLTTLADSCPQLEELHMNLSYYRHHNAVSLTRNDADPLYDQALYPDQIPKWPSSIRVIDFEHVRHWSVEAAEMFLQSLIDSADRLPNLRHLGLKTMLNIPWKLRADMRHEWRRKLDRVFLRPFEPPKNQTSLRQPEAEEENAPIEAKKRKRRAQEPSRRSGRLAAQISDSDSRHSSGSRGLRNLLGRPLYKEPDTDEDELSSDLDDEEPSQVDDNVPSTQDQRPGEFRPVIQGLCNTVSLVFDNQKPRELQYGMEDFLDEARADSDEEWDGDDDDDDTVFVWR